MVVKKVRYAYFVYTSESQKCILCLQLLSYQNNNVPQMTKQKYPLYWHLKGSASEKRDISSESGRVG